MKLSIVIPTYYEGKNLKELFDRIFKVVPDAEVIVVDDNSQDDTSEICAKSKITSLIVRRNERGLATACVEGFKDATGDIILVMDADLQHPPEHIPNLVKSIESGYDIAIGSRFTDSGSVGTFGLKRRIISKGAETLSNTLFPKLKTIKDKQSGFFAFKKDVIKDVKLNPVGYKILLEILVAGNYKKVDEVGFTFGERFAGDSKLGSGTIFSYLNHMFRLSVSSGKLRQIMRFLLVGLSGTFVNLMVLYLLTVFGLFYLFSGLIAIEFSLLTNFFLNRYWTFSKEAKNISFGKSIVKDHIVRIMGVIVNFFCLIVLTEVFLFNFMVSMTIGIVFATMWNLVLNMNWIYKEERNDK